MDAGSGEQTLVTGFVVEGDSDRSLLVRAAGPSLGRFGVTGVLGDPLLKVHQGSTLVGQNNDWAGAETVNLAARAAGAFDFHSPTSRDAALLINLPPGAYTAQVTDTDPTATGNVLVEVYTSN